MRRWPPFAVRLTRAATTQEIAWGLLHVWVTSVLACPRVGWPGRMCTMQKSYPREFREDVLRVARGREPGVTLEQVATDFGVPKLGVASSSLVARFPRNTCSLNFASDLRGRRALARDLNANNPRT